MFQHPQKALHCIQKVNDNVFTPRVRLLQAEVLRDNGYVKEALQLLNENEMKNNSNYYYLKGLLLVQVDDDQNAIIAYKQALTLKRKDGTYWYAKATALMNINEVEQAIPAYKNALVYEEKSSSYFTWSELGEAYLRVEEYSKAKVALEKAVKAPSEALPVYYYKLSHAYRALGELDNAIKAVKSAINLHDRLEQKEDYGKKYYIYRYCDEPSFQQFRQAANELGGYRYQLFSLLKECGREKEAVEVLSSAIKLMPEQPWLRFQLADYYTELQNYDEAIKQYETAIELDQENGDAYFYLGHLYMDLERYEEALGVFSQGIEQFSEGDFFFHERHKAYLQLGNIESALADMNVVIENNPHAQAFFDRSYLYFQLGHFELALTDLQDVIDYDEAANEDIDYHYALGNVYFQLEMYEVAVKSFTFCLEHDETENKLRLYERRAQCLVELEKYEEALQDCNDGLVIEEEYAPLLWVRGYVYLKLEKPIESLHDAEKYLLLDQENPAGYYNLGLVQEELNLIDEAMASYSTAITIDEAYAPAYYRRAYLFNDRWEKESVISDLYHWLMYIDTYRLSANEKISILEEQAWVDSDIVSEVREKFEHIYGNSTVLLS
jgi:tetratricopeptide (TPR) repeat protein